MRTLKEIEAALFSWLEGISENDRARIHAALEEARRNGLHEAAAELHHMTVKFDGPMPHSHEEIREAFRLAMEHMSGRILVLSAEEHRPTALVEAKPSSLQGFLWKRISRNWWGLYSPVDEHAADVWDNTERMKKEHDEWEAHRVAQVGGEPDTFDPTLETPFVWHTWNDENGTGGENSSDATLEVAMREVEKAIVRQGWHEAKET